MWTDRPWSAMAARARPATTAQPARTTRSHARPGTYLPSAHAESVSDCISCPGGSVCNGTGLSASSGLCAEGYYCAGGAVTETPASARCPSGSACPLGSDAPEACADGTYSPAIGRSSCLNCPAGFTCPPGASTPTSCLNGGYCPDSTGAECTDCPVGQYCDAPGLVAPAGQCEAGFFCPFGSRSARGETAAESTSPCPAGNYCPGGSPSVAPAVPSRHVCAGCGQYQRDPGLPAVSGRAVLPVWWSVHAHQRL